ncbi:MAG: viscotoxin-A3 [Eggerthellaceae bacterium]|nr:viscotoxin-A3 [Eggerthellaceae bacterium]
MAELSDEQIKQEKKFLKGIPRFNIGAFLLPPVWGPAHGIWASIIFYPLWLVADNSFYAAFAQRTPLAIALAAIIFVVLVALTIAFSLIGQPIAAHRAANRGKTKEQYLKEQRIWAAVCVVVGIAALAAATYYNLVIRPTMGE